MPRTLAKSWKIVSKAFKSLCRRAASPLLPLVPDALANRLPFLGRIAVRGPGGRRIRFYTYGPAGKDRIALKLCRQGVLGYEAETMGVYLALVEGTSLVVDVGANTGVYALLAAVVDSSPRVVAFEPVPPVFATLEANIRLNDFSHVVAEPLALSDHDGEVVFYVSETGGGIPMDSSLVAGSRTNLKEFRLPAVTLDQYLKSKNLGKVDVLKIDAETAEPQVLAGAGDMLRRDRPLMICEVLNDACGHELRRLLDPLEYRYFHLTSAGLVEKTAITGNADRGPRNYLFATKERVGEVLARCKQCVA